MPSTEDRRKSQGARDVATALPFAALVLFMPPIILIAAVPERFAGVPVIFIYIFGIWAAIMVAAFFVARILAREDPGEPGDEGDTEDRPPDIS